MFRVFTALFNGSLYDQASYTKHGGERNTPDVRLCLLSHKTLDDHLSLMARQTELEQACYCKAGLHVPNMIMRAHEKRINEEHGLRDTTDLHITKSVDFLNPCSSCSGFSLLCFTVHSESTVSFKTSTLSFKTSIFPARRVLFD